MSVIKIPNDLSDFREDPDFLQQTDQKNLKQILGGVLYPFDVEAYHQKMEARASSTGTLYQFGGFVSKVIRINHTNGYVDHTVAYFGIDDGDKTPYNRPGDYAILACLRGEYWEENVNGTMVSRASIHETIDSFTKRLYGNSEKNLGESINFLVALPSNSHIIDEFYIRDVDVDLAGFINENYAGMINANRSIIRELAKKSRSELLEENPSWSLQDLDHIYGVSGWQPLEK